MTITAEFVTVTLSSLQVGSLLPFDLYFRHEFSNDYSLYLGRDSTFTEEISAAAESQELRELFVPENQRDLYFEYCGRMVSEAIVDPSVPVARKAEIAYEAATRIVEDVFANPRTERRIELAKAVIRDTVDLMVCEEEATQSLVFITRHDYTTYSHSVNVAIFAVALAQRFHGRDPDGHDLRRMGEGFLFHDLGKSLTPLEILHKPGPLDPDEWEVIRRHPEEGFALIPAADRTDESIAPIVLEHHERTDGSGYPYGLSGAAIHPYAKICAIADTFDAITTVRAYRGPLGTFEALRLMHSEMGDFLDPRMFTDFVRVFSER